jgi:predicted adenine nucleotide alpha hydrolase (AANH) superfamily ATPase
MKIAIHGKMCYGKTTLANIIRELDDSYKILSFGQKVKDIAKDLFDMKYKDRTLLTNIGTKMREIDANVWANYTIEKSKVYDKVIIDDLRYQNEHDLCIKNGYKIIVLTLPKDIQIDRLKTCYPDNYMDHIKNLEHESENSIECSDCLIIDMSLELSIIKNIIYKYLLKD